MHSPVNVATLGPVIAGLALVTISRSLDGFAQGLCVGAGIALILAGVALLSAHQRRRRPDAANQDGDRSGRGDGMWLPSRDEDERP
ncbi:hypothetical protein ACIRN4_20180 [Pimelobacter simplex]|uniref:Uncharacterized protein n=1 Tax=Nocardioides simplex TaxID=2045 RepID=A0A0A1DT28_NOCSI|nr:hypothetical protein [Pimelobacter simplex]AIY18555.1 hypothetical protein KR76_20575 [Pimelobacter simplex]MCG8153273.1 hypothetical protein [Pimelobacter simplex]GEB14191.1 hypothetical protein NSI01_25060 [Pimelobacter simplex]SFM32623.1 hypothetical protein SAMN05421671_1229 [Pimelobacter simplex]